LEVLAELAFDHQWVHYVWWFSDTIGAYEDTPTSVAFFAQRQNEPVVMLREYRVPPSNYVMSFTFAGSCFAVAVDVEEGQDVWLHDMCSHDLLAEYGEKDAIDMQLDYSKRHHMIVASMAIENYQSVRLLGADDLTLIVSVDNKCGGYSEIRPMHPPLTPLTQGEDPGLAFERRFLQAATFANASSSNSSSTSE
jgi:hypothetical protein